MFSDKGSLVTTHKSELPLKKEATRLQNPASKLESSSSRTDSSSSRTIHSLRGLTKKEVKTSIWSRVAGYFSNVGHSRITNVDNFSDQLARIAKLCVDNDSDLTNYALNREREEGMRLLIHLEYNLSNDVLSQMNVAELVRCSVACFFYFSKEMQEAQGCRDWSKRKECESAEQLYQKIIKRVVLLDKPDVLIRTVSSHITFIRSWGDECLCLDALEMIVSQGAFGHIFLETLIDEIDNMLLQYDIMQARQTVRVLFGLLTTYQWDPMTPADEETIYRFFENYHHSLQPEKTAHINYVPLKKGFEVCARRLFENLDNYDILKLLEMMCNWIYKLRPYEEDLIPEMSNVVDYAASLHRTYMYEDSLPKDFFRLILKMIASDRRLVSLVGTRVLQQILDRHSNLTEFDTPKIFFQETNYMIACEDYSSPDKELLRTHRSYIHDSLLRAVVVHGHIKANLEAVYATTCLMIVEVTCGYTAAASVCLAMAIQDAALTDNGDDKNYRNHLHAVVMAVMTLLCWIHKAEDLFKYVSGILKRRSDFAPHLNPPLSTIYKYAQHHILWDKPDMFFENWEVRYGLWMHFRTAERILQSPRASILKEEDSLAIAALFESQTDVEAEPAKRGFMAKNVQRNSLAQRKGTVMVPRKSTVSGDVTVGKKKGSMQSRKSTSTNVTPLFGKKKNTDETVAGKEVAEVASVSQYAEQSAPTIPPSVSVAEDAPPAAPAVVLTPALKSATKKKDTHSKGARVRTGSATDATDVAQPREKPALVIQTPEDKPGRDKDKTNVVFSPSD